MIGTYKLCTESRGSQEIIAIFQLLVKKILSLPSNYSLMHAWNLSVSGLDLFSTSSAVET